MINHFHTHARSCARACTPKQKKTNRINGKKPTSIIHSFFFLVSRSGERASRYRYKTGRNTIHPIQYCNAAQSASQLRPVMFSICLPCYFGRRPKFDAFSGARPLPRSPSLASRPPPFARFSRFPSFKLVRERTKTETKEEKRRKRTRRRRNECGEAPSIRNERTSARRGETNGKKSVWRWEGEGEREGRGKETKKKGAEKTTKKGGRHARIR